MIGAERVAAVDAIARIAPVIPVLTIRRIESAVPLAQALVAGGLRVLEITLRREAATDALQLIRERPPDVVAGAGTILDPGHPARARAASRARVPRDPTSRRRRAGVGAREEVVLSGQNLKQAAASR